MNIEKLNPIDLMLSLIIKGICLGVILAIAIPVRSLIDKTIRLGILGTKDALRKKVSVTIKEEVIAAAAEETEK